MKGNSHWYFNKDSLMLALRFGQAHGLPKIIQSKSNILKLSWFIVFIIATIATIYYEIIGIESWYRNEYDTKIETILEQPSQFPAVFICFYSFNTSLVNANLNDTLLQCKYGFNDCDLASDFNVYYDLNYGKCYKFITNKPLNQTGALNGLQLYFNTRNSSDLVTFQIAIDSSTNNNNNYLNGMIGYVNNIIVSKQVEKKLGKPFNDCQNDSNNKNVTDYLIKSRLDYKQNDCFHLLYLNYAALNCGINGSFMDITEKFWINFSNEKKNCFNKALINFDKDFNQCPQECDSINYQTIQSIYRANYLDFNEELNSSTLSNDKESKYLTKINVYFTDFKYVSISQSKQFELIDIIGSVSNILCFFLGASYLTCLEFVEYIFIISGMLIYKLHKKFKHETIDNNNQDVRF